MSEPGSPFGTTYGDPSGTRSRPGPEFLGSAALSAAPRPSSGGPVFSIVIPYRDRLENLRLALASLADQTLDATQFEVVLGVMEYSDQYLAVCREYADRLTIVSVLSDRPWQVGYARNLAIRQATGDVLVLMDVDMALPPGCLEELHARYFAYGQRVCVVGQMIDYDNNTGDVASVEARPYAHYRKLLNDLRAEDGIDGDPRMRARHVIPWSFAWTALVALPRALVTVHDLWFDLAFKGYGVEDLEWAYRVSRTSTPIVMGHGFLGLHLPHVRDVAANKRTEAPNYRHFLRKWPGPDVELACALGDFEANEAYLDFRREVERAAGASLSAAGSPEDGSAGGSARTGSRGRSLAVGYDLVDGESELVVGLVVGGDAADPPGQHGTPGQHSQHGTPKPPALPDGPSGGGSPGERERVEVLPLVGVALPYEDGSVERCLLLPPVLSLAPRYREAVLAEARRVSRTPPSLVRT